MGLRTARNLLGYPLYIKGAKRHITVFDQTDVRLDYTATGEIRGVYSGQVPVVLADSSLEYP